MSTLCACCVAGDFDKEFDDKQSFLRLINNGWLEKTPTSSVKKSYTKRGVFATVPENKWRLSLSLQVCIPCCRGDRAFLVARSPW